MKERLREVPKYSSPFSLVWALLLTLLGARGNRALLSLGLELSLNDSAEPNEITNSAGLRSESNYAGPENKWAAGKTEFNNVYLISTIEFIGFKFWISTSLDLLLFPPLYFSSEWLCLGFHSWRAILGLNCFHLFYFKITKTLPVIFGFAIHSSSVSQKP